MQFFLLMLMLTSSIFSCKSSQENQVNSYPWKDTTYHQFDKQGLFKVVDNIKENDRDDGINIFPFSELIFGRMVFAIAMNME